MGLFELVVILVACFFLVFVLFLLFSPPLAFLTTDPKTPSSVLFTFLVGSRCVHSFMQTNCSGTYIVCAPLGHGWHAALAAFTTTSWLVLPAQCPELSVWRASLRALLTLLGLQYPHCISFPRREQDHLQLEGKWGRSNVTFIAGIQGRQGDPRDGWCYFSMMPLLQSQVTSARRADGLRSMRLWCWEP